jgi:hypothetical protein
MGWETRRNGRTYYYQKARDGRSVRSQYIKHPALAALLAGEATERRLEREAQQAARRALADELAPVVEASTQLDTLLAETMALAGACLTLAGYHQHHRGAWRRRRHDR